MSAAGGDEQPPMIPGDMPREIRCWRCGKLLAVDQPACPYCAAPLRQNPPAAQQQSPAAHDDALVRMLWFFGGLLTISVVHGLVIHGMAASGELREPTAESALLQIGIFELISTAIVLAALCMVRPPSPPAPEIGRRVAAWIIAWPLLASLLMLNIAYHWWLREGLGVPALESEFAGRYDLLPWLVLLTCVQPAVIEELFFRYTAVNVLQTVMRPATVVVLTSLMFGLAHIGVPLSIPVLVVLGAALGWMRIASGGVLLPMSMHFVHNAVVVYLETSQAIP